MNLRIIPMSDPILYTPCSEVPLEDIRSTEVQDHIQQLHDIYDSLPAVGLAAPQVGWSQRVFIVGIEDEHSREDAKGLAPAVYINPTIEITDDTRELDWEACFSVYHQPKCYMNGQVNRYRGIRLKAYDRQGEPITLDLSGFKARVFQHENDHLDGIRYVNRIANGGQLHVCFEDKDYKLYMHQLPKAIRSQKLPILNDIIPVIANAPHNTISKKLVREILATGKML